MLMRLLKLAIAIITLAMLIHTINGVYIEPRYLGFTSPADYADPLKLSAASKFWSWKLSGTLHLFTGIALLWLTPALKLILRRDHSLSDLTRYASLLASACFVLTGILSIPGGVMANFVAEQNNDHFIEIIAGWSIITYSVRTAAMFMLAVFVGLFSWTFESMSKGVKYFGYFTAAFGVLVFLVYWLPSMLLFLIWGIWMLVELQTS
jgi:hypothetical protein